MMLHILQLDIGSPLNPLKKLANQTGSLLICDYQFSSKRPTVQFTKRIHGIKTN